MKRYEASHIRNVALAGHGGSGKTQLAEAMLFATGAVSRMGRVDEGNTASDWDPEETKRRISISTSLIPCEWKGHKVNVLDTPGYFDFVGEVQSALQAADAMVCVVCAASGVEVGTEKAWAMAEQHGLPRAFFVNKMDRDNADFDRTVAQLRETFGQHVVPLQVPIGQAETFSGLVDLVSLQAYAGRPGGAVEPVPLPEEAEERTHAYLETLKEAVAATDDELTLKYLEEEEITADELRDALARAIRQGQIVPVWLGSALRPVGADALLDGILQYFPSAAEAAPRSALDLRTDDTVTCDAREDAPLAALVFKTVSDPYVGRLTLFRIVSGRLSGDGNVFNANKEREERVGQVYVLRGKEQMSVPELGPGDIGAVNKLQVTATGDTLCRKDRPLKFSGIDFPQPNLTLALVPKAKGDEEKIGAALARIQEEDPTLRAEKGQAGQLLVSGLGDLHLEILISRLARKFGVEVDLVPPKVPYRETIRASVKAEGKHKKQTGGRGQYGHVFLELSPLPPGSGFEFEDKIFGGAVPKQYIPAVEKGVRETMEEGVLAGYPVVDVKVTLYDGSYHSVDSSEMAFKIAASMAFKKGFAEARPVLLEPVMLVEVTVPERFMGDVIGDLNKKRGRILGMDPDGNYQVIRAHVPMAEMVRYAVDLRSITQGRGSFRAELDHYEEVPEHLAEAIISESRAGQAS
ncbi:MAG: elongation factor G [Firmicutes bacterium]|nr:elongation factor G [Bacillota bacterium]